jgi:hypothetical protein
MRWIAALGACLLLASCRPQPGSDTTSLPPVEARRNDAASLADRAATIVGIEIVALDDRRVLARCDDALLDAVRRSIAGGGRDGLTATPPAWPVVLRLVVRDGPPFIAHLVGQDRLRLCPVDPWRDCLADPPRPAEVAVPFELFEDVSRKVGTPPRREYRTDDGPSPF